MIQISTVVENEIQQFKEGNVEITPGVYFNQYLNIQHINKYLNNRFWELNDRDAIFWNIATPRIPLFAKSIDMDSKDFKMFGKGEFDYFPVWVLNARFRKWVKDTNFALKLDDTSNKTTTYGSSVWKRVKKYGKVQIENVNLRNLYFDPTVENIIDTAVVELHYMSETQIRAKFPDKADEIVEKAQEARDEEDNESETTVDKYEIWERWGEFKQKEEDDYKYWHHIGSGSGDFEVVIFEEKINIDKEGRPTDFPYYDFHLDQYSGRWQRIGVVERLFILQERMNTIVNQNAEATQIASLLLFKTEDPNTHGNILQSAVSGQIINSADMAQMGIDNRAAGTILNEMASIEKQADDLCFITETVSGETPPSGVPFRSLAVAANASKNTFKFIGTSIGEKMALILQEDILPSEVKNWKREDVFDIAEDENDIRVYDQLLINKERMKLIKFNEKQGLDTADESLEERDEQTRKKIETSPRRIKMNKTLFDFEWGVDMNPTGEGMDKNAINSAIDGAIQDLLANPNISKTPIYKKKLEINGIPPFRLSQEEIQALAGTQTEIAPQVPQEDKLSQLVES